MNIGRTKILLAAVAALAMLIIASVPFGADDSSAESHGIDGTSLTYVCQDDPPSVSAGKSVEMVFYLQSGYSTDVPLELSASCNNSRISAKVGSDPMIIMEEGSKWIRIPVTVDSNEYAHEGEYKITVSVRVTVSPNAEDDTGSFDLDLSVTSNLTSNNYNKFLGYIPNHFDGILGNVWFTAIASFFALLAIGYAVVVVVVPICTRIITRKDDPERPAVKKTLYNLCHAIILIWAIGQVLRILGTEESLIDIVNRIFMIVYAIVGVIVAWHLYKIIIDIVLRHMSEKEGLHSDDIQSLRPLFLYLGEMVIAIIAVMIIMNFLGFNLAAIITSAGIVSLGISMGAQDVLKQFFAGIVILATRPFKRGDLIRIGTDSTIYKVRKVNVMFTELANWDNTDVNLMPNSTIETSRIQNITGETLVTKVYLTMDIAYGQDISKARRLMEEAACKNPNVISDGSYGMPYTRVEEFGDSNITIKMGMYFDDFNKSYTARGHLRQSIIETFYANGIDFDYNRITIDEIKVPASEAKGDYGGIKKVTDS